MAVFQSMAVWGEGSILEHDSVGGGQYSSFISVALGKNPDSKQCY